MKPELPVIVKLSMRILASVEEAVTRFPHRHKYALGADLRAQAMRVARCARLAWRDSRRRVTRVHELSEAVDDLKLCMMLADAVKAFRGMNEFEAVSRLIVDLGRQVGGWLKALHSKGQNGQALPDQRAQTLSSRAAPCGATP